jgi:hypothetical protein
VHKGNSKKRRAAGEAGVDFSSLGGHRNNSLHQLREPFKVAMRGHGNCGSLNLYPIRVEAKRRLN